MDLSENIGALPNVGKPSLPGFAALPRLRVLELTCGTNIYCDEHNHTPSSELLGAAFLELFRAAPHLESFHYLRSRMYPGSLGGALMGGNLPNTLTALSLGHILVLPADLTGLALPNLRELTLGMECGSAAQEAGAALLAH